MPKTAVRHELDPNTLRSAIVARLPYRSQSSGALQLPAIPALVDHYTSLLIALFAGLGHRFSADERADGTGCNTLPLAKAGFRVDAVELALSLAALLRAELDSAGVHAQVFEGDALALQRWMHASLQTLEQTLDKEHAPDAQA